MNNLVARQEGSPVIKDEIPRTYYPGRGFLTDQEAYPTEPFIFLPRKNKDRLTMDITHDELAQTRIVPLPYLTPMPSNQGNNPLKGGFDTGRALGAMAGYLGMGFGDPAFSPGLALAGRYSDLMKERNERIDSGWTPGIIPEINTSPTPGIIGDLLAKSPSFEIPQGQGRNPDYSIYNDPRMPGARNLRRKLEGILGLPKVEFPKV